MVMAGVRNTCILPKYLRHMNPFIYYQIFVECLPVPGMVVQNPFPSKAEPEPGSHGACSLAGLVAEGAGASHKQWIQ